MVWAEWWWYDMSVNLWCLEWGFMKMTMNMIGIFQKIKYENWELCGFFGKAYIIVMGGGDGGDGGDGGGGFMV